MADEFARLELELESFRSELKRNLDLFERRLTFKFGLMFFTGVGITIVLIWHWA